MYVTQCMHTPREHPRANEPVVALVPGAPSAWPEVSISYHLMFVEYTLHGAGNRRGCKGRLDTGLAAAPLLLLCHPTYFQISVFFQSLAAVFASLCPPSSPLPTLAAPLIVGQSVYSILGFHSPCALRKRTAALASSCAFFLAFHSCCAAHAAGQSSAPGSADAASVTK